MTKDKTSELIHSQLRNLENKYLIADWPMVSAQNRSILEGMLPSVKMDFDALMTECVMLADGDALPGTDATKNIVIISKLEFDNWVRDWLNEVRSGSKPQVAVEWSNSGKGVTSQVFSPDDQNPPACFVMSLSRNILNILLAQPNLKLNLNGKKGKLKLENWIRQGKSWS